MPENLKDKTKKVNAPRKLLVQSGETIARQLKAAKRAEEQRSQSRSRGRGQSKTNQI